MKKQKAFTLIELLVVIAIIGLLSGIVLISVKSVIEKAKIIKALQFSSQSYHAIGSNAVGYWDFNDNFDDISKNNDSGINYGVDFVDHDISSLKQALGKAGEFDGNSYVEIPDNSGRLGGMKALTIEFWINFKPASSPYGVYTILYKEDSYHAYLRPNGLMFFLRYYPTGYQDFGSYELVPEKWHHILVSWDYGPPMERMSYLNGKLKEHTTGSSSGINIGKNNNPLVIGKAFNFSFLNFNGLIDGVRVYEEILDIAQVQKLYVKGAEERGLLVQESN